MSSQQQQATVLSGAQASQLMARLRVAQAAQQGGALGGVATSSSGGQQTIKIQAVQTNPQTGVRQIIAIPISAVQQQPQSKVTVSPMKVKSVVGQQQHQQQVKVVKLATPGGGYKTTLVNQSHSQVLTPSKQDPQVLNSYLLSSPGAVDGGTASSSSLAVASSGKKRSDIDFESFSDPKRRKTEKGGKGLRHFSMKVCEKVQAKGSTSYNEVADELVAELTDPRCTSPTDQQYDQKNIRRRVYDALNVLMAMNIISKEKKEIRWLGLPTNSVQEASNLEVDKSKRMERIRAKTQQLQDLILQQIAFKNLVERNKDREKADGCPPAPNSAIQLPFIIVNTSKKTVIDCSISNDKMEYLFNFDNTFEIHDDMEVLKRMGLSFGLERGQVSGENLAKAQSMVPKALEQYVTQLAENGPGASFKGMPAVSDPVPLRQGARVVGDVDPADLDEDDEESDVDIN